MKALSLVLFVVGLALVLGGLMTGDPIEIASRSENAFVAVARSGMFSWLGWIALVVGIAFGFLGVLTEGRR